MLATKNWGSTAALCIGLFCAAGLLNGCSPPGAHAFLEGDRLLREGKYAPAIAKLKMATELIADKAQPRAWNHLGLAYHRAGRIPDAIQAYQHALRLNPNLAVTRFNLGSLYFDQGNFPAAIAELTAYTVFDPQSFPAWLKAATAQLRSNQLDDAEKSFLHAQQLNPASFEVLNGLGLIQIQRKRLRESLTYFNAALEKNSSYGPALLNLAIIYHQLPNNRQIALRKYREYLELKPRPPQFAAVEEVVKQIEAELNPPRVVQTNLPPALTNILQMAGPSTNSAPRRAPTNAPPPLLATSSQDSKTPTAKPSGIVERPNPSSKPTSAPPAKLDIAASAPAKAANAIPQAAAPPGVEELPAKIEVVTLTNDPPPKLPEDFAPSAPPLPTNTLMAAASRPASERPATPPDQGLPAPKQKEKPKSMTRRVLDRMNPLGWFGGKSAPATEATPRETAPIDRGTVETEARPSARPLPPPAPVLTPRPQPPVPRYSYRSPARPSAGDRGKAQPFFADGLRLHREQRHASAIESYREAVKLDPAYFEAHYNLALAAYQIRDLDQSLAACEYALALDPGSTDARYNFALGLDRGGYARDAANELEKLLAVQSGEAKAHFALAKIYAERLGQTDSAREHYRRVLALNPGHSEASAIRYWLAAHP